MPSGWPGGGKLSLSRMPATLRMPDRIDQVMGDGAAFGLPGDGNDARPDRHVKGVRG